MLLVTSSIFNPRFNDIPPTLTYLWLRITPGTLTHEEVVNGLTRDTLQAEAGIGVMRSHR